MFPYLSYPHPVSTPVVPILNSTPVGQQTSEGTSIPTLYLILSSSRPEKGPLYPPYTQSCRPADPRRDLHTHPVSNSVGQQIPEETSIPTLYPILSASRPQKGRPTALAMELMEATNARKWSSCMKV